MAYKNSVYPPPPARHLCEYFVFLLVTYVYRYICVVFLQRAPFKTPTNVLRLQNRARAYLSRFLKRT